MNHDTYLKVKHIIEKYDTPHTEAILKKLSMFRNVVLPLDEPSIAGAMIFLGLYDVAEVSMNRIAASMQLLGYDTSRELIAKIVFKLRRYEMDKICGKVK